MKVAAVLVAIVAALGMGAPSLAAAHDFTPGVLSIVEQGPGLYRYAYTPPVDDGVPIDVEVRFPEGCRADGARLACPDGLAGAVSFPGLHDSRARIVILYARRDGSRVEALVSGAAPRWSAQRSASAAGWVGLGVTHVLFGYDHLAFVVGLLLVIAAGRDRGRTLSRAVLAISAFTVAHSVTLALAVLDLVDLPSAPVEASIAASVLLLAHEASHGRETLTRRAPWVVALLFGLVHGLGFAEALRAIGLPRDALLSTLLAFNVGVELAQLAVVGIAVLAAALVARVAPRHEPTARLGATYTVGALGAYWLIDRAAPILAGA